MAKIPALAILVLQLFRVLLEVSGQSPCSRYVKYMTNSSTGELMGQIQIPSPSKNIDLHLQVVLSFALPIEYDGPLELADSNKFSVQGVQQGKPLLYRLRFLPQQASPMLNEIWFNQHLYCKNIVPENLISVSFTLWHGLYPSHMAPSSQNPRLNASSSVNPRPGFPLPFPTHQPDHYPTETTKRPIVQHPMYGTIQSQISPIMDDSGDCGRSTYMNNVNRTVSEWKRVWPWLATVFVMRIRFEYSCTGSVLTNRHVLTAAHCCKLQGANISPNLMLVSLGQSHLRTSKEKGSVNREVATYSLHPDHGLRKNRDSDIALLVLRNPIEFSPTISPVCLWSGPDALQSVIGKLGYMMRWVQDKQNFQIPQIIKMSIVSQEDCLRSDLDFVGITSNRTFCAGTRDGVGPCNGDSGSGLVLLDASTGRYQLRGIVSSSLFAEDMNCDLKQYVVFIDVAKYVHWIKQQISFT